MSTIRDRLDDILDEDAPNKRPMNDPLVELVERVTKATGPDREIDVAICLALSYIGCFPAPLNLRRSDDAGWLDYEADEDGDGRLVDCTDVAPELTASTDAALALVERKLPGVWWIMSKGKLSEGEALFACQLLFGADESLAIEDADTLPLAIILALLRALSSQEASK